MNQEENNKSKELEVVELYLESLKEIAPLEEGELERLFYDFSIGKKEVKNRIAEVYLMEAIKVAAEYRNRGIALADLIQEANIGLMIALAEKEEINHELLIRKMKEALEAVVEMESKEIEVEERLVRDVNFLNDVSKEISERTGETPTLEELVQYLGMTEEEVKTLMKISLDAL